MQHTLECQQPFLLLWRRKAEQADYEENTLHSNSNSLFFSFLSILKKGKQSKHDGQDFRIDSGQGRLLIRTT